MISLGFVVNPVAGMGGRVGLKGTDGVVQEALRRGAKPVSPRRAAEFLEALKRNFQITVQFPKLLTCKGPMGEDEAKAAGLSISQILDIPVGNTLVERGQIRSSGLTSSTVVATGAGDTKAAVREFLSRKVDVLIFVGGDGTARDVLDTLNESEAKKGSRKDKTEGPTVNTGKMFSLPPVLGVPSGVKMYSGVFALNPVNAAEIIRLYAEGKADVTDSEVMDIDEEAFRRDQLSVRLYGYMKCLYVPMLSQASKEVSPDIVDEKENQKAIAKTIIENMDPEGLYILGPGTTINCLADMLKIKKTILGVDLYHKGKLIALDVDENTILGEMAKHGGRGHTWIVVSPIGRQGMIFGRGNQQISPRVIKEISKDHIIVSATKTKIRDLDGGTLKVDTGDNDVDNMLRGYMKVLTDYREWRMLRVR